MEIIGNITWIITFLLAIIFTKVVYSWKKRSYYKRSDTSYFRMLLMHTISFWVLTILSFFYESNKYKLVWLVPVSFVAILLISYFNYLLDEWRINKLLNEYNEGTRFRELVLSALGSIKDERSVNILIKALNDKDINIRNIAAKLLGKLKDVRAIKPLISRLEIDDGKETGKAMKESLAEIRNHYNI